MRGAPLPESCSVLTTLHEGAFGAINDWRCAGHDSPGRDDECCDADRIVVTRRGVYEITLEGTSVLADGLVATCWNEGDRFRVRHPAGGTDHCTVFRLSEEASRHLRRARWRRGTREATRTFDAASCVMDGRTYLAHRAVLAHALRAASHGAVDALAVDESIAMWLERIARADDGAGEPLGSRERERIVATARDLMVREYARAWSLDGLAREAGCSPFHLSRLFRRATGLTLHRALMRFRLREGLERLLDAPERISSIALDVGFATHGHFTDAFRAEYGCAPRVAREMAALRA